MTNKKSHGSHKCTFIDQQLIDKDFFVGCFLFIDIIFSLKQDFIFIQNNNLIEVKNDIF